ncbi:MAG: hypothetical protein RIQ56_754, partial [Candidatus Parcubacteria bacterium]
FGWGGVILMATYPWLVHAVGLTYPALDKPVGGAIVSMPEDTLRGFIAMAAVGFGCALLTAFAAWVSTRVVTILLNIIGNVAMTLWISIHAAKHYGAGTLKYYQLYSAEIAILATLVVVAAGVFGAWNKNPTQVERGQA